MRTLTGTVVVSATAVLAGCGGQSRDELTREADAICARYSEQGTALGSPDVSDPSQAKPYFAKAAALARRQQEELEGLEPDGDAEADFTRFTDATQAATTLLSDLADASGAQDGRRYASLVRRLGTISDDVDATATKAGADKCAG